MNTLIISDSLIKNRTDIKLIEKLSEENKIVILSDGFDVKKEVKYDLLIMGNGMAIINKKGNKIYSCCAIDEYDINAAAEIIREYGRYKLKKHNNKVCCISGRVRKKIDIEKINKKINDDHLCLRLISKRRTFYLYDKDNSKANAIGFLNRKGYINLENTQIYLGCVSDEIILDNAIYNDRATYFRSRKELKLVLKKSDNNGKNKFKEILQRKFN